MPLERRNEPQMLRQFHKMYPSYNINPLMRRRHQQLVEVQGFNEWLSNRRLRQQGETYADELGRMTEAVNRTGEKRAWYRDRPDDAEYYRIQRELLRDGLTRKARLTQLPPHEEGAPTLWAIGLDVESPLKRREAEHHPLHISLAFDDELSEEQKTGLEEEWGEERQVHQWRQRRALAEVGSRGQLGERPAGSGEQLLWPATAAAHQLLVNMEERRSNGFRVKPSFNQALGYIAEGEPLNIPLPNRNASIYVSSHFYLDDFPNAPEPISDAPLPHTTLNPAAAFETADEGSESLSLALRGISRGPTSYPPTPTRGWTPGLPNRHGLGERAPEPATAPNPGPAAPGPDALRAEQRSDPSLFRQRALPASRRAPMAQPSFDALRQASDPEAA
eukprot:s352_g18.t1